MPAAEVGSANVDTAAVAAEGGGQVFDSATHDIIVVHAGARYRDRATDDGESSAEPEAAETITDRAASAEARDPGSAYPALSSVAGQRSAGNVGRAPGNVYTAAVGVPAVAANAVRVKRGGQNAATIAAQGLVILDQGAIFQG